MAFDSLKADNSLNIEPKTTLLLDQAGDLGVDASDANRLKYFDGSIKNVLLTGDAPPLDDYITGLTGDVIASGPGVADAQIAAGAIIDADVNAAAAIALSKLAPVTASRALVSDVSGVIAPSTVTSTELTLLSGVSAPLVTTTGAQTLTNKTIVASANSISAITNANIDAAAAIDRTKIANGTPYGVVNNNASGTLSSIAPGVLGTVLTSNGASSLPTFQAVPAPSGFTTDRALVSDGSGAIAVSSVTATELGYVSGVTSAIQTQLNSKAPTASPTFTGTISGVNASLSGTLGVTGTSTLGAATVSGTLGVTGLLSAVNITASGTLGVTGVSTMTGALTVNGGIVGTIAGGNATTGNVGEYQQSLVSVATNVPAATTAIGDATSLLLQPGDWDISALASFGGGGGATTFTAAFIGISTTAGNSGTGLTNGVNRSDALGNNSLTFSTSIPNYRVSISVATTYYLKMSATYTSTPVPVYFCRLSARRIR